MDLRDKYPMRKFIDILTEASADYAAMINPLLSALKSNTRNDSKGIAVDLADEWRAKIQQKWDEAVRDAKVNLKKADRITWYLRLVRAILVEIYSAAMDEGKANKLRQDYNSRVGLPVTEDGTHSVEVGGYKGVLEDLMHFLSLPIPEIQNYQFRYQPYKEIYGDFVALEDKWKDTVKNSIEDDESKPIIDCGNNWFWVDTEKAYCSKEAAAMGHCGNSPRQHSGDHLLSLRKKIQFGDQVRWEPHLTFILADDGYLTEMKGKGNEKPAEKYHPMIVKLLESNYIDGIRGGGYLPQNNFAMSDLDDEVRERLVEMKPELGTIADAFEKLGPCDKIYDRLVDKLNEYGLSVDSWEDEDILIETWQDVEYFLRRRDGEGIAEVSTGDFSSIDWLDEKNAFTGMTILAGGGDEDAQHFLDLLSTKTGARPDDAIAALEHMFPRSVEALWEEVKKHTIEEAKVGVTAIINEMRSQYYDLNLRIHEDGSVSLSVDFENLVRSVTAYEEEVWEITNGFEYCVQEREWLPENNDDMFDDEDKKQRTDIEWLKEIALSSLIEHIAGLFEDDDQLSFDF